MKTTKMGVGVGMTGFVKSMVQEASSFARQARVRRDEDPWDSLFRQDSGLVSLVGTNPDEAWDMLKNWVVTGLIGEYLISQGLHDEDITDYVLRVVKTAEGDDDE